MEIKNVKLVNKLVLISIMWFSLFRSIRVENSLGERTKRSKEDAASDGGGIIIDASNDYPNENYYYDNYDLGGDTALPGSIDLNNTYKVETIGGDDGYEEKTGGASKNNKNDFIDAMKPPSLHHSHNKGKNRPSFIPNESDEVVEALAPHDSVASDDDETVIKIDAPASPPLEQSMQQFKPSQHQNNFPAGFNKTSLTNLNTNNNKMQSKQYKNDKTGADSISQKTETNMKLFMISTVTALVGLTMLLGVSVFACYMYRKRSLHYTNAPEGKMPKKTSNNKQYVAVEQT